MANYQVDRFSNGGDTLFYKDGISGYVYDTENDDVAGRFHVSIPGFTGLYDGLTIKIRLMKTYNGTYNTLVINDDVSTASLIWYRSGSRMTSHFGQYGVVELTYFEDLKGSTYTIPDRTSDIEQGTVCSGGWVATYNYYNPGNYNLQNYYFRPYAGSTIYRYKLCMLDADNRLQPIVLTNQTTATQVAKAVNPVKMKPNKIYYYGTTTNTTAGSVLSAQALYDSYNMTNATYSFNASINTYKLIYLKGTLSNDGLFTLYDDGNPGTNSYYIQVPTNTASITLSNYFTEGYYYILVGGSYSTVNYYQLFINNDLYYFDGTNLKAITDKALTANSADKVEHGVRFTSSGTGDSSGAIFDGSADKNISYNTIGAAALSHTHTKSEITDFPTIPTVYNGTLTIQKNGTTVKTFTANSSSNVTANITVPTKVSELTNDSGFLTSHQSASAVNGINIGSATQGVYINANGKPTVMTYTLGKSVPSTAIFTDANVAQNKVTADNNNYPILARDTTSILTSTRGTNFAPNIYINPYDVSIHASTFVGNLTGNVTGNVSGSSGSCTGNAATASSIAWAGITGVPAASTSAAGIIKIGTGATNAAAGNHTHNYAGSVSVGGAAISANKVNNSLKFYHSSRELNNEFDGSETIQLMSGTGITFTLDTETYDNDAVIISKNALTKSEVTTALGYTPPTSDTNYYHSTGAWSGLTYTATANGGAPALAFTLPTGTSATTVAAGNHTHNYAGSSSAGGAANSVKSALTVKYGTTQSFTYNGSAAKTLSIKAGNNISITGDTSGSITISGTGGGGGGESFEVLQDWSTGTQIGHKYDDDYYASTGISVTTSGLTMAQLSNRYSALRIWFIGGSSGRGSFMLPLIGNTNCQGGILFSLNANSGTATTSCNTIGRICVIVSDAGSSPARFKVTQLGQYTSGTGGLSWADKTAITANYDWAVIKIEGLLK